MAAPGFRIPFDDKNLDKLAQYRQAMKAVDTELRAKKKEMDDLIKKGATIDKQTQDQYDKLSNLKDEYKNKANELKEQRKESKEQMHELHNVEKISKGIGRTFNSPLARQILSGGAPTANDVFRQVLSSEKFLKTVGSVLGAKDVAAFAAKAGIVTMIAAESIKLAIERTEMQQEATERMREAGKKFGAGLMGAAEFEALQKTQENTVGNVVKGFLGIDTQKQAMDRNEQIRKGAEAFERIRPDNFGKMLRDIQFGEILNAQPGLGKGEKWFREAFSSAKTVVADAVPEVLAVASWTGPLGWVANAAFGGEQTLSQAAAKIKPLGVTQAIETKLDDERRAKNLPELSPLQRAEFAKQAFHDELSRQGITEANIAEFSKKLQEKAEKDQKEDEERITKREISKNATTIYKDKQNEVILEVERAEHYRRVADVIPD
jgi:hypothetical protein